MRRRIKPDQQTSEVTSTEFRIVLTWGETPRDLDSHLVGLDDANSVFHIAYYNKVERDTDGNVIASLDVDDVSSYGPETVTIVNARTDATYYYSVKTLQIVMTLHPQRCLSLAQT